MTWLSTEIDPPEKVAPVIGKFTYELKGKEIVNYQILDLDIEIHSVVDLVKILDNCGFDQWKYVEGEGNE